MTIKTTMTMTEVRREFKARWRERCKQVPAYANDKPAMRQDFSFFVDELHREGRISDKVAQNVTID